MKAEVSCGNSAHVYYHMPEVSNHFCENLRSNTFHHCLLQTFSFILRIQTFAIYVKAIRVTGRGGP
jgi:hypothetical protein